MTSVEKAREVPPSYGSYSKHNIARTDEYVVLTEHTSTPVAWVLPGDLRQVLCGVTTVRANNDRVIGRFTYYHARLQSHP